MPRYDYRCRQCGDTIEVRHGFNDEPAVPCVACGTGMVKVISAVRVAPSACPTRTSVVDVAATNKAEKRKAADMDAYKRLRRDGVQPPEINGSAKLEAHAETGYEITAGHTFRSDASRRRTVGILDEMAGKP